MSTNASIVLYKRMLRSGTIDDFPAAAKLYLEDYGGVERVVPVTVLGKATRMLQYAKINVLRVQYRLSCSLFTVHRHRVLAYYQSRRETCPKRRRLARIAAARWNRALRARLESEGKA